MVSDLSATQPSELPIGWRFKLGIILFALALIPYGLVVPLIFYSLPLGTIATFVGAGVIFQKVVFVSAVAVLGKFGFRTLKTKVFAKFAPPDEVGPMRYRIGLALFTLPILQGLIETYVSAIRQPTAAGLTNVGVWRRAVNDQAPADELRPRATGANACRIRWRNVPAIGECWTNPALNRRIAPTPDEKQG